MANIAIIIYMYTNLYMYESFHIDQYIHISCIYIYIHAVKQISAAPWLPLEHREYELLVANCSLVATQYIP